jgi:putative membrane protein
MLVLENILIGLIAILHFGFLILEMFLWTRPLGLKTFNLTEETAKASAALAANQGLYNGFLASGLIWGLISDLTSVKLFFLACIILAGAFGGLTAKRSILYIQGLPALIALILVLITR